VFTFSKKEWKTPNCHTASCHLFLSKNRVPMAPQLHLWIKPKENAFIVIPCLTPPPPQITWQRSHFASTKILKTWQLSTQTLKPNACKYQNWILRLASTETELMPSMGLSHTRIGKGLVKCCYKDTKCTHVVSFLNLKTARATIHMARMASLQPV